MSTAMTLTSDDKDAVSSVDVDLSMMAH